MSAPHPAPRWSARPIRPIRRAAATVLAAAGLLSACGGTSDNTATGAPSATTAPAALPETTVPATTVAAPPTTVPVDPETPLLDELLDARADGRITRDGALAAFAATYGGLPGVTPSDLDPEGIEGTTAVRWLTAHRDELSEAQLDAIDAAMTPRDIDGTPLEAGTPPGPAGFRAARAGQPTEPQKGCFGGAFPFADAPGAGRYRDLVRLALAELSMLLGPLDVPVYTAFSEFAGVNADLNPWAPDCDQPAQACQIRIAPLGQQMSDSTLVKTLAHELTHCYQARMIGARAISPASDWIIEGFASFVGETVGQSIGNTMPNYWWDKWFKWDSRRLFDRVYDALGFFAVVQQAGGDPFATYQAALQANDDSVAFQTLTAGVSDHLSTIWGATRFRQPERGLFWDLTGPGVTGYQPVQHPSGITSGGGYSSAISEAQAEADLFDLRAEVVTVVITGPVGGRASFAGQADQVLGAQQEWCTLGYPCVCPDDTQRAGTVVEQAPAAQVAIGVAGIGAGTLQVTGMTFDDYCGPKTTTTTSAPVPPAVDACLIGSWVSGTWTTPGPPGLDLALVGGSGIAM